MKIVNILELIGKTPIVRLNKISPPGGGSVWAKLERVNPGGSVKDRIALSMIEDAEKRGIINKDTVIIEPTSGNTGIGLAMVCAVKGYKLILVMPDTMSIERRKILTSFGAEIILTPGAEAMTGAVNKASEIFNNHENYFMPQQFKNPANPRIHAETTAKEILEDFGKDLSVFVCGVGTGGTITGAGGVLKKEIQDIKLIAVEPEESPVLSGGKAGPHKIQGIGAGFIPDIMDLKLVDEIVRVKYADAKKTAQNLAKKEGLLSGVSSGAVCFAAIGEAKKLPKDKNVLVILPDTGERYLSTELFD
ncbi:MAG: cysteine synthase A [Armatimonadota bacterium]